MPRYITLDKSVGQTPLQAIEAWRAQNPEYTDAPATYAGRLDPMASGKLLILLGDECKKLKEYTGLDKEYEIEVVLGVGTDTGDALGLPVTGSQVHPSRKEVENACRAVLGSRLVPYPSFSSKTVNGIPLFQYALEGRLGEINVPTHIETIYMIRLHEYRQVSGAQLLARIQTHLTHVPRTDDPVKRLGADFRQDEIRTAWKKELETRKDAQLLIIRLPVICASGTYMRTLAERLGKELGTAGFALTIHRSKIGRYRKIGPFGFWTKRY
jgi:tRNA pseudouridine(55) synthase